ncbi:MAG: hypothetical protein ACD_59C00114G0001 [uncultured bacterium]|nr:MAG: hypothetical protein ACD_59C00114G0001 [uncultured bacterium]
MPRSIRGEKSSALYKKVPLESAANPSIAFILGMVATFSDVPLMPNMISTRKTVRPEASMFSATPETTWLDLYLMQISACMAAKTPAAAIPQRTPVHGEPV